MEKRLAFALSLVLLTACNGGGGLTPAALPPAPSNRLPGTEIPASRVPPRYRELLQVSQAYGKLIVRPGEIWGASSVEPWSGYWYPRRQRTLFDSGVPGTLAPLQKYDLFAKTALGVETHAANYEEHSPTLYDPWAPAADGLCHAWAAASLLEREPIGPVTLSGITFEVQDLKALLTKVYEQKKFVQYGQRFEADATSVYGDIYADQFHQFMIEQLVNRSKPFVMDRDPGIAVWNTPVWRVSGHIEVDPNDRTLLHVSLMAESASPFVEDDLNFVGSKPQLNEYTYDLVGYPLVDGSYEIAFGEWTGASVNYHPDFVQELPDQFQQGGVAHSSENPEIKQEIVDQILSKAPRR